MIDTHKKIKMTVTMDVTIPQALALQAMFEYWNGLGNAGATREVAFYTDGDGNFHPNAQFEFSEEIPMLNDTLRELALVDKDDSGTDRYGSPMALFDFDSIAWKIGEH